MNRSCLKKTQWLGRAMDGHPVAPDPTKGDTGPYLSYSRPLVTENVKNIQEEYEQERARFVRDFSLTSKSIAVSYIYTERHPRRAPEERREVEHACPRLSEGLGRHSSQHHLSRGRCASASCFRLRFLAKVAIETLYSFPLSMEPPSLSMPLLTSFYPIT